MQKLPDIVCSIINNMLQDMKKEE